jgi:ribokinase
LKVLTIGSAMIDSIAIIPSDRVERMTMRNAETSFLLLEEGKKTEAEAISTHCGGGAVNAAVAYARLGCDAAALIKLGRDARADQILTRLAEEGVSTRYASRDDRAPTGASVLVSAHDRNAAVFAFRGANTLLEPGDLKTDAFGVDLVHVSGLSNKSAECFPDIVAKAKAAKARLAVNPGVRQLSLQAGGFMALASEIDILSINRSEADVLVPQIVARAGEGGPALATMPDQPTPRLIKRGFMGGGFEVSISRFFKTLLSFGFKQVIVTDSGQGAFAASGDTLVYCPALSGHVAGTAGAGDAFVSTFAAYTTGDGDVGKALQLATLNAASVIQHPDTQTGLMKREALEAKLSGLKSQLALQRWPLG